MTYYNPETGLKRCCKCKQHLPLEQFPRSSSVKDGYDPRCKTCRNAKPYGTKKCPRCKTLKLSAGFIGEYCEVCAAEVEAKRLVYVDGKKRCAKCREYKNTSDYTKNKTSTDGYSVYCKSCVSEDRAIHADYYAQKTRKYQKLHPEKIAAYQRKYNQQTNYQNSKVAIARRFARKKDLPNTLTLTEWRRALAYFNGCCAVCGRQLKDLFGTHTVSADHWKPLSKGGGTTALNIIPLCHGVGGCNNHKSDKLPDEWLISEFGKKEANKILARIEDYFTWVKAQV